MMLRFGGMATLTHICQDSLFVLNDFAMDKDHIVKKLRQAVAQRFRSLDSVTMNSPEVFLNWLLARVMAKRLGEYWWCMTGIQ